MGNDFHGHIIVLLARGGIAVDSRAVGGLYGASIPSGCDLERACGGMAFQGSATPGYLL
jgi:hypothetical protein